MDYLTIDLQCLFCNREVRYPKKKYKRGQPVFCSLKCNRKFVARVGSEQQEKSRGEWRDPHR